VSERLAASPQFADGLVVDPDSRLSQLGLCLSAAEETTASSKAALTAAMAKNHYPTLTSRWAAETFQVHGNAYIAPIRAKPTLTSPISLGVGEPGAADCRFHSEKRLIAALLHATQDSARQGSRWRRNKRVETVLSMYHKYNLPKVTTPLSLGRIARAISRRLRLSRPARRRRRAEFH